MDCHSLVRVSDVLSPRVDDSSLVIEGLALGCWSSSRWLVASRGIPQQSTSKQRRPPKLLNLGMPDNRHCLLLPPQRILP
jgi:hypothetical protein